MDIALWIVDHPHWLVDPALQSQGTNSQQLSKNGPKLEISNSPVMVIEQWSMKIVFMLLVVWVLFTISKLNLLQLNIFLLIGFNFSMSRYPSKSFNFSIRPTEIWSLSDDDEIGNINIAEPTLDNYVWYPEIFLVASDFCTRN